MEGFAPKTIKGAGIIGLSLLLFPILCLGEIQTRGTLNTFSDLPKFLPDEIIVKFKSGIPAGMSAPVIPQEGCGKIQNF